MIFCLLATLSFSCFEPFCFMLAEPGLVLYISRVTDEATKYLLSHEKSFFVCANVLDNPLAISGI
jgi:hypothetical protein